MRITAAALVLGSSLASMACATYQDDLKRAEHAYDGSEDERALAIFRILEPDLAQLSLPDRAHYAYLRGMTDFRIGYRSEARHWLSLAAALDQKTPGSLPPDWQKRMNDSLKDLNEAVFTGGIESLTNQPSQKRASDDAPPDENAPKK